MKSVLNLERKRIERVIVNIKGGRVKSKVDHSTNSKSYKRSIGFIVKIRKGDSRYRG